jgi:predicted nucleic-acid-binding protein
MIGIDTNILVRILVDDDKAANQCKIARNFVIEQDQIFISSTVLVETIWVLQRAYAVDKKQILDILNRLLLQESLVFENRPLIEKAIEIFQTETFGFSDALILASNEIKNCHLFTFDKKLAKHALATELK